MDNNVLPVEDYYIGNTHIRIFDTCCVKTKEEEDAILARVAKITVESIIARERREKGV